MSDDELQNELAATDHDEASRNAIIGETLRRVSRAKSRPNWVQWLTLMCAIVAALLAAVAALPVIENLGESRCSISERWKLEVRLRRRAAEKPSRTRVLRPLDPASK